MDEHITQFILSAESKALATSGENGINVVPVSSIKVVDGKIWLINYFMDKTVSNILEQKDVSLVCWKAMMGYQIKGFAQYLSEGSDFDEAVSWIKSVLPDRVVKGLIIITPKEIHDIAPSKNTREVFRD